MSSKTSALRRILRARRFIPESRNLPEQVLGALDPSSNGRSLILAVRNMRSVTVLACQCANPDRIERDAQLQASRERGDDIRAL